MPRQTIYRKPVNSLRKVQLKKLALDLDISSDGTVSDLRDRINTHLNNHRNNLSQDPRFKQLFPRRHHQGPIANSSQNSRSGSPTLSNSSTWHGIQEVDNHDLSPGPQLSHASSPASTPVPIADQGMSNLYLFFLILL